MDHDLNISDVIEVLQTTDPQYVDNVNPAHMMFTPVTQQQPAGPSSSPEAPYAVMLEQPAPKALRFRYECEGRSAGSIPGVNSTPDNKTYPTIKVVGYQGRAVVVVSCVTKDVPHRPHPHNLVGKDGFRKGVCTLEFNQENMTCVFSNLGIQCVKKKDIEEALKVREEIRVDPFMTGFSHRNQPTSIDLNAVRLAFQVFIEGPEPGKLKRPLKPIVSDPIYDKKDISVRFYEEKDGQLEWEGFADFQPTDVHKQVAIGFRTPAYKDLQITKAVDVKVQLRRPSDMASSEPKNFKYLPLDSAVVNKRKQPACVKFPPSKRAVPDPAASSRPHPMAVSTPGLQMQGQPQQAAPQLYQQPLGIIKSEPLDPPFLLATSPYQPALSPSLPGATGLIQQQFQTNPQTPSLSPLQQTNPSPQDNNFNPNATFLTYSITPTSTSSTTLYTTLQPLNNSAFSQQNQQQQQLAQFITNYNPAMPLQNLEQYDMAVGFSGDLNNISLSGLLDNSLSDSLSGQLKLTDTEPSRGAMNMSTDSINRFTIDTYDKIVEGSTSGQ